MDHFSVVTCCSPVLCQVDELKQQVRALQAVGYGTYESDLATSSSTPGPGAATANGGGGFGAGAVGGSMTLEGMLLAKSRKLEHELTMARLQVRDHRNCRGDVGNGPASNY